MSARSRAAARRRAAEQIAAAHNAEAAFQAEIVPTSFWCGYCSHHSTRRMTRPVAGELVASGKLRCSRCGHAAPVVMTGDAGAIGGLTG